MSKIPCFPFETERLIGTVVEVTPTVVKMNLPEAARPGGSLLHGSYFGGGEVGEFVCIETPGHAVVGRILSVRLPERDRLTVETKLGKPAPSHPIGTVQLLSTLSLQSGEAVAGIVTFPRIGSSVYSAHPDVMKWVAEATTSDGSKAVTLKLATLSSEQATEVSITPEKLFGRHCAILGSTGGGKSWTIARITEELSKLCAKSIIFDATGEYHVLADGVTHVHFGQPQAPTSSTEVVVPYRNMSEQELFAMFRPSGQTQGPKLRAAMRTLKLLHLEPSLSTTGTFQKAGRSKASYETAYQAHFAAVENELADFEIDRLAQQIEYECCFPTGTSHTSWGNTVNNDVAYCTSLIGRITSMIDAPELACIFRPAGKHSLFDCIDSFLANPSARVLRVSMKNVPFAFNAREIVANAAAKYLLSKARLGSYSNCPVLVILDEAHNFINKTIGDDFSKFSLDAFENIAREGRKFCLTICMATQRPRDLPEGVISQMGTLIVHRLTNHNDREVVERASGDIDRSAATFLPTLAPGEAILVGADFAFPLSIRILPPTREPDSKGPDYQRLWKP